MPKSWKCPSCALECAEPRARCWCGKYAFGALGGDRLDEEGETERINACRETCDKVAECIHGGQKVCRKGCHPGRCEVPCEASCADAPVIPRNPGGWERLCGRLHQRKTGQVRSLLWSVVVLIVVYVLLGVFCKYHVQWWSKPFRYTDWRKYEGKGFAESLVLVFCGMFFIIPGITFLLLDVWLQMFDLLVLAFNLRSSGAKWLVKLLILVICVGVWILPILG